MTKLPDEVPDQTDKPRHRTSPGEWLWYHCFRFHGTTGVQNVFNQPSHGVDHLVKPNFLDDTF
ncbi:hypothetical protein N7463_006201 [Penicillium fimorum]|uniref:Uncharacterized protein n=1 Tax=Penicillium fimorum TaxID=1882269 RepID=A0A9W9XTW7_9EURO|nr:hypothetical protein N7463_006201 [Penicillium fimorum]